MLATEVGSLNMKAVRLSEVKVIMVQKNHPGSIFVKHSFAEEFKQVTIIKKPKSVSNIEFLQCFKQKIALPPNKKTDLMMLCNNNVIPDKHKPFYEGL